MKRNFARERVVSPIAEIPGEIRKARPFWRRVYRNVGAVLGIALLMLVTLVGIFAPQISPTIPWPSTCRRNFNPPRGSTCSAPMSWARHVQPRGHGHKDLLSSGR